MISDLETDTMNIAALRTPLRFGLAFLPIALVVLAPSAARAADYSVAAEGGYFDMSNAKKSAKAIFDGSSGGFTGGGSFRLALGRRSPLFVGVGAHFFSRTGERVFVAQPNGTVFRLGHPLKLRLVPVYALVGWTFLRDSALTPYVAVGAGVTSYREESTVGGVTETTTASKGAVHFAAGADYRWGVVRLGAEVMYSLVPNTIGESGVSKVYGEKDVGGLTIVGRLGFGSRY
jgi:hypothetical protein